ATAVVFGEQHLSYDQLNRQANRLAHKLREQGVGPDVLVGIAVERSLEMIVGLLAILKAGGAYVPLDPAYPKDRLAYMIEDSGIGLLLTQSPLLERLSIPGSVHSLCLDRMDEELSAYPDSNLENLAQPENLAYVIYTSGSTGQPKGTALRHNSFVNLLHWFQQRCELTAQDKVLLISSYSFDLTQKNLHGILCAGGQLHIPAGTTGYDPDAYRQQIAEHGITLINCAPSAFYPLLQGGHYAGLASLRHVLLGGEPISLAELSDWLSAPQSETVRLHNTYGPTECTDVVVAHTLENLTAYAGHSMPTGRPLPGVQTYILDNGGYPVAPGVIGELHIGGFCVGEGYWHKAGLTAERFIPDPFDDQGGRLYRTGDLARYRADGVIEYMGRIDHQVKIRGFRIELGEIEARLQQHLAVREAVVIDIDGSSGKQLAGYLVPSDPSVLASEERQLALRSELKEHLKTTLPDYMVPAHLILLERMSLTPNGKLDRKALPRPDISLLQQEYVAPQSELEQQLAGIWAQVLKVERV
ncbi:amino acid adenylation domain-containing protein, partial [Azomonas macrocytogenes]